MSLAYLRERMFSCNFSALFCVGKILSHGKAQTQTLKGNFVIPSVRVTHVDFGLFPERGQRAKMDKTKWEKVMSELQEHYSGCKEFVSSALGFK